jgi:proprotein convertase subtilisin/kexin type 5
MLIGMSELLIVVSRCGGLYGTNCLVCSSFNNCTTCRNSSYYINGADCVQACPTAYYTYQLTMTCYESCPVGAFNINSNLTCASCPSVCKSCVSLTVCLMCNQGYFLDSKTNSCVSQCPDRYFGNSLLTTCDACVLPCLTCISMNQCTLCYFGFL